MDRFFRLFALSQEKLLEEMNKPEYQEYTARVIFFGKDDPYWTVVYDRAIQTVIPMEMDEIEENTNFDNGSSEVLFTPDQYFSIDSA